MLLCIFGHCVNVFRMSTNKMTARIRSFYSDIFITSNKFWTIENADIFSGTLPTSPNRRNVCSIHFVVHIKSITFQHDHDQSKI